MVCTRRVLSRRIESTSGFILPNIDIKTNIKIYFSICCFKQLDIKCSWFGGIVVFNVQVPFKWPTSSHRRRVLTLIHKLLSYPCSHGAARIHCIIGPHMQILQRNLPKLQPFLPCLIHYIQYNTQCHFSYTLYTMKLALKWINSFAIPMTTNVVFY